MYLFHNDYNMSCHPAILEKVSRGNDRQYPGYGDDDVCHNAAALIRNACSAPEADVHFLVGGTQTNLTVAAAGLRPYQAMLGAQTAHVNVHETGAIEATGHKVETLPSSDGKLTAEQIRERLTLQANDANAEHAVQIKMVYISHPTELGTTYTKKELEAIRQVCDTFGVYLFMDGARLGYALSAWDNDLSLADIARLCHVFYIGGTKLGALFGEAVVITEPTLKTDFRYLIKQRGAMLAKGWLLGQQFEAFFEDGLYFRIGDHANKLADKLRATLSHLGYPLFLPGTTNQVFAVLPDALLEKLEGEFTFMLQEKTDTTHSAVRFCTSWATTEESVDALCRKLESLS
ncbi:MAG: aminotransferase class I/II-fold pyridoxal phosphate-dependent enzyme [Oscillospiraceae bacterium]|nr:aminotransferase class I/II-fold pyridoxal phosphate-dependent enzyme [Oscillospiraceae bacterium]